LEIVLDWVKPATQTLSDQVAEAILVQIARGDLVQGSSLPPQRELARELGVGLSVVREAIQRLQVLKVVRTRQGSGSIIGDLRWNQIAFEPILHVLGMQPHMRTHIREARYAIEKETTRLAALRATAKDLKAIREVIGAATPPPDTIEENRRLNTKFHMAIAHASKNAVLIDMLAPLMDIGFVGVPGMYNVKAAQKVWNLHNELYEAISAHDVKMTERALNKHMKSLIASTKKVENLWKSSMTNAPLNLRKADVNHSKQ
jgi:GntR family transcriptional repressor for pyruvate dehydrogenase complex